jgi:hypothetical protein
MKENLSKVFTEKQWELAHKHGTPAEFAEATYKAVPGFISMDEARAAIEKYNKNWSEAGGNSCS